MTRIDALEQVLTAAEAVLGAREDQMLTRIEWDALHDAVRTARGRTTYYVATLARYVLVDAADEDEARRLGEDALRDLDEQDDAPIRIATVRPATAEEIELQRFHEESLAREAMRNG